MHERGGKPVSEDRGGSGPTARAAPALLVTEHGAHAARCREIAAATCTSVRMRANRGGAAPLARPDPKAPGSACIDTMRLAN